MNIAELIFPFGVATYSMLILTILSGALHIRVDVHRALAAITIILATLHAGIVLYLKFF